MGVPKSQAMVACPPLEPLQHSTFYYKHFSTQKCITNGKNARLMTEFWSCHLLTMGFQVTGIIKFLNIFRSLPFSLYILLTFWLIYFLYVSLSYLFFFYARYDILQAHPVVAHSMISFFFMTKHYSKCQASFLLLFEPLRKFTWASEDIIRNISNCKRCCNPDIPDLLDWLPLGSETGL